MSDPTPSPSFAHVDPEKAVRVAINLVLRGKGRRGRTRALRALRDDMTMCLPRDLGPNVVPIRDNRDPESVALARLLISAAACELKVLEERQ